MIVSNISSHSREGVSELSANVFPDMTPRHAFRVWFRFPPETGALPTLGDPFLAGFLIPCMCAGENLHIEAPVSSRLLKSVPAIQKLICDWYPEFVQISTTGTESHELIQRQGSPETATFFSGGVDSVYTLLKHHARINQLILVHGFENPVQQKEFLSATRKAVSPTCHGFDKEMIVVHTNLRQIADQNITSWGKEYSRSFFGFCYQGSILAAVGLCLQNSLERVFVPASHTHNALVPYGSHPSLDPLWSTENLDFIHDGCEASRFQKVKRITAEASFAANSLQVCESNLPDEPNCCHCDKCVRTMMALRLCGVKGQSRTFQRPLDLRMVRRMACPDRWQNDYQELLSEARTLGDDEIADALSVALRERFSLDQLWGMAIRGPLSAVVRLMPWLPRLVNRKSFRKW